MSLAISFTLVSTVFNEAKRLEQTIQDLENQTLQPSEIIITDAGSSDGTYEKLLSWKNRSSVPIVILQEKGCNVARGRNLAIKAASHDIIVSTDFGCRFNKEWLATLVEPFSNEQVKVVGGGFSVVEADIQSKAAKAGYLLSDGYKIDATHPDFIPSSRSIAYRREVYNKIGGYCEWLTLAADDLVFGKQILKEGYQIFIASEPLVYWGRHAKTIGYVKEAFRYGLGDGEARVNQRSVISNSLELVLRYLFFASVIVLPVLIATGIVPVGTLFLLVLFLPGLRSYVRFTRTWLREKSKKYNFTIFLCGLVLLERTRISYIRGFIKGYFFSTPNQRLEAEKLQLRLR